MTNFINTWGTVLYDIAVIIAAGLVGFIIHFIIYFILNRLNKLTSNVIYGSLIKHTRRPVRFLLILVVITLALPVLTISSNVLYVLQSVLRSLDILLGSWLLIASMNVAEDLIMDRYKISTRDNLQARRIYTQTSTIKKVLAALIIIIAIAFILLGFDPVRQIGTGILASAGIVSVVIGLAAQKIFGNFLAGIQIAFTQPIRLDDVVVIENEWGKIEEITLTYVVVRIWDLRRLILPISYFIDTPFQNWTRVSADILGTVYLYTDYTIPVNEVREELQRILKSSDKWDGKVWGLQVTDSKENVMELRALMSAADSSLAWDLRCQVREKLIEFIQTKYPQALPRTRAELHKIDNNKSDN
jgi:small-conductance mechanosensitive channel